MGRLIVTKLSPDFLTGSLDSQISFVKFWGNLWKIFGKYFIKNWGNFRENLIELRKNFDKNSSKDKEKFFENRLNVKFEKSMENFKELINIISGKF